VLYAWASQGDYTAGVFGLTWAQRYNRRVSDFRFIHPMEVRYGDLDPQGHLNNAKYLTYFEQARVQYLTELGLFSKDQSFSDIGVIIADIHIQYLTPVFWGAPVRVGVRTTKIGGKSLTIEQWIMSETGNPVYARGTVILVAYDYRTHTTMPVPEDWRQKIMQYDGPEVS
jgi:acyl-CoA thioester hydrolase